MIEVYNAGSNLPPSRFTWHKPCPSPGPAVILAPSSNATAAHSLSPLQRKVTANMQGIQVLIALPSSLIFPGLLGEEHKARGEGPSSGFPSSSFLATAFLVLLSPSLGTCTPSLPSVPVCYIPHLPSSWAEKTFALCLGFLGGPPAESSVSAKD